MRRRQGRLNGERYCGNSNEMEVHDLDNEKLNCQIDKIIAAGHEVPFNSLETTRAQGYDNCA